MAKFIYPLLLCAVLFPGQAFNQCFDQNISLYKPVTASSTTSGSGGSIVDGNVGSQWASDAADPQWIYVDLGIVHNICALVVQWDEIAYARDFEIQLSDDGDNWEATELFQDNDIPELLLDGLDWDARYVRLYGQSRADTLQGYKLRELTVFGTLEAPYQQLSFAPLPDRLSTDVPFELEANSTSGLPVSFNIVSGPATISGNVLTLTGEGGTVVVRASQEGNVDFNPAEPIERSFEAVNPEDIFPEAIITSPSGAYPVVMPELGQIAIGVHGRIERPQWFSIAGAEMEIDGQPVTAKPGPDGHYYNYWPADSYGMHTLTVRVTGSTGNITEKTLDFEVVPTTDDVSLRTFDEDQIIAFVNFSYQKHYQMPTNLGAFDKITANLSITCPEIGCDSWDRIAHIDVRTPEGNWVEIIRYITPYGVECSHTADVTPYASLLQGNPEVRMRIETYQRGWEFTLDFDFEAGPAPYRYSKVEPLWYGYLPFGDPTNRQPADTFLVSFQPNIQDAKLYLVGTGHGWGENNSSNAAEFYEATHHVLINGQVAFAHHNWRQCDPNPDACQPQNGTWFYNRAGWCPGAISPFESYDMAPYLGQGQLELFYRMSTGYVDYCHPHNPTCVSGLTCPNCNDGFNPHLVMATNLVTYSNEPIEQNVLASAREPEPREEFLQFSVYPNPTPGSISIEQMGMARNLRLRLYNLSGQLVYDSGERDGWPGLVQIIDLSSQPTGLYQLLITTEVGTRVMKVVRH